MIVINLNAQNKTHSHNDQHQNKSRAHTHNHAPTGGVAFGVGIGLNLIFVVVEIIYGLSANSMSLVADAAYNAGDVVGLGLAWGAMLLAKRAPSSSHTYGLRRSTIFATLMNAVLLLVAIGGVIWEAIGRLTHPGSVEGGTVMIVAGVGVLINGVSALFFFRGKDHDANIKGAFLHLAADAAVSVGVVIASFIISKTGWQMIDPIMSIVISLVILVSTWALFKDALNLSLDAVPGHIDLEKVKRTLAEFPNVSEIHDLHIWAMSTTEVALTAHIAVSSQDTPVDFLKTIAFQ